MKSSKKGSFGPPICRGKGHPTFQSCIFKLHLLHTTWPDMVEFHSASSEGSWQKKKERKRRKNLWQNISPPTCMSGGLTSRKKIEKFVWQHFLFDFCHCCETLIKFNILSIKSYLTKLSPNHLVSHTGYILQHNIIIKHRYHIKDNGNYEKEQGQQIPLGLVLSGEKLIYILETLSPCQLFALSSWDR